MPFMPRPVCPDASAPENGDAKQDTGSIGKRGAAPRERRGKGSREPESRNGERPYPRRAGRPGQKGERTAKRQAAAGNGTPQPGRPSGPPAARSQTRKAPGGRPRDPAAKQGSGTANRAKKTTESGRKKGRKAGKVPPPGGAGGQPRTRAAGPQQASTTARQQAHPARNKGGPNRRRPASPHSKAAPRHPQAEGHKARTGDRREDTALDVWARRIWAQTSNTALSNVQALSTGGEASGVGSKTEPHGLRARAGHSMTEQRKRTTPTAAGLARAVGQAASRRSINGTQHRFPCQNALHCMPLLHSPCGCLW
jgi:hypothetical protein